MTTPYLSSNHIYPCWDEPVLSDLVEQAHLTWRYYATQITTGTNNGNTGYLWSAMDAIQHVRYGPGWQNVINPPMQILTDVANGQLANFTWVTPDCAFADHAACGSNGGPEWVTSIVNAIGASPYWNSTAILVIWDEWGGWYDHVAPPSINKWGLGFRVPLLVISPYVKHGYISHVQHESASTLKFAEVQLGLGSLNQADARADDLRDFFDFTQTPAKFTPLATKRSIQDYIHMQPTNTAPDSD